MPAFQFEFKTQIEWNIVLTDCGHKACRGENRALLPLVIAIWNGALQGPASHPTSIDLVGNKVRTVLRRHTLSLPRSAHTLLPLRLRPPVLMLLHRGVTKLLPLF